MINTTASHAHFLIFSYCGTLRYSVGGVDFWIFWIFDLLQLKIDWQKNSKTKVEKLFFFISISLYSLISAEEDMKIKKNTFST
jgi:hypothetical protein